MDPRIREDDNMLIDTHCHLTDGRFSDIGEVLKQAQEAGVQKVIVPSTSVEDAKKALGIAEKYGQYCLVGIHPEEVENLYRFPIRSGMTVNETGLPQRWSEIATVRNTETLPAGRQVANDDGMDSGSLAGMTDVVMELAVENNLPVAIHMREAEEEVKEELDNFMRAHRDTAPESTRDFRSTFNLRGQFHCFAGSEKFLEMILERGFYVSFCGNITYKTAGNLRELLKRVPLDRLLLETDSPYLAPESIRGTVNTPANVKMIAEFIARELGTTIEKLANSTTENAKCLYSLDI